jgi:Leucine-rich repeat (LRR) protein
VPCPTLRLLHITDNNLQDWAEVRKIGPMFPGLETLVMANCNLSSIQDSEDMLRRLFPNLRSINLHNSGINQSRVLGLCPSLATVLGYFKCTQYPYR